LEPSVSGGYDLVGIGTPVKGFCFCFVMLFDEAIDCGLSIHA
jgi:hypothetical protein